MPRTGMRERKQCAPDEKPKNEELFRIYLFVVAIMIILALVVPSPVQLERAKLDRLSGQTPATFVANVFVCVGVDGRVTDTYCLKARTDVQEPVGVDRKGHVEGVRRYLTTAANSL